MVGAVPLPWGEAPDPLDLANISQIMTIIYLWCSLCWMLPGEMIRRARVDEACESLPYPLPRSGKLIKVQP